MKAITVGRFGSKMAAVRTKWTGQTLHFPLYSVKLYEARPRQRDGKVTWRFVEHLSESHSWEPTVETWAHEEAARQGLPFMANLTHGMPSKASN